MPAVRLLAYDNYWFGHTVSFHSPSVVLRPHPSMEPLLKGIGQWESFFMEGGEWHLTPFGWGLLADWLEDHWTELEWIGDPSPDRLTYLLTEMRTPLLK